METSRIPTLRRRFDEGQRLCDAPLVHTFDGFVSPALCAHLIALASPRMGPAMVSNDRAADGARSQGRTNRLTWLPHDTSPLTRQLGEAVSAQVGLPLENSGAIQVIRYGPGEQYVDHYDAYDLRTGRGQRTLARGGQRLITALGYLNRVEGGGETAFPRLGLSIRPEPGRLVVFHNCHPGTDRRDERSLHAGMPVTRGEKWAFNIWFRTSRFQHHLP